MGYCKLILKSLWESELGICCRQLFIGCAFIALISAALIVIGVFNFYFIDIGILPTLGLNIWLGSYLWGTSEIFGGLLLLMCIGCLCGILIATCTKVKNDIHAYRTQQILCDV